MSAALIKAAIVDLIDGTAVTPNLQTVSATVIPLAANTPSPVVLLEDRLAPEDRAAGSSPAGVKLIEHSIVLHVMHRGKDPQETEEAHDSVVKQITALLRGASGGGGTAILSGAADSASANTALLNFAERITVEKSPATVWNKFVRFDTDITVNALEGLIA